MIRWKYFRQFELREALEHADAGGIAIHESGQTRMGKPTVHLLAGSRRGLVNAAEEVRIKTKYVQLVPYDHFDLFGRPLMLALQKCLKDEEGGARRCRSCGCTDEQACPGGCSWTAPDLCSVCAGKEKP